MITKMQKYTFLVFHREYERFLERLRDVGVVHVSEKAEALADDELLQEQFALRELVHKARVDAEKYLVEGAHVQELQDATLTADQLRALVAQLRELEEQKQTLTLNIAATDKEAKRMMVWGDFSEQRLTDLAKAGYALRFFSCPKKQYDAAWEAQYQAVVVAEQAGRVYFVVVGHEGEELDLPAEEQQIGPHSSRQLRVDIDGMRHLLAAKQAQLEAWTLAHLPELRWAEKQTDLLISWQRVSKSGKAVADNRILMLEGFCPVDNVPELEAMLADEHIYFIASEPTEEDDTPVKLRNNRFTKMFEPLTGMYGWPVYGEFDPTPILAPFFLLFFALCMGDAGYGILLILFGILTTKGKLNIEMFSGLGPIITTLGVGTLIVGFFLGTFFGIDLYTASWVPESMKHLMIKGEVAGYDIQMVMALCIGVVHICLAMTIKAICYTKRFGFKANISTWGWLLLILGALVVGILSLAGVFSVDVAKWTLIVIGGISALAIYIFNTPGRNPLINIGAGLWDTYNMATGILGDVLSYIRLYALGLAGGMLGGAFNSLGLMVLGDGKNALLWVAFVVILIIGHLLNLCMSALGAFVHPLRLSFVEYFKNSGYEGKGHLYEPFRK